jgi:ATPase family associated with various cellular activities (AAA)
MRPADDLQALLVSRNPLILVQEGDEVRFLDAIRTAARGASVPVWTWSATKGLARDGMPAQYGTKPVIGALTFVSAIPDAGAFVFLDVRAVMADAVVVRTVKDLATAAKQGQTVILTDVDRLNVPDLAELAVPFTLEPPETDELKDIVTQALAGLDARKIPVTLDDAQRADLIEAVRGMGATQAARLIQQKALTDGHLDAGTLARIREGKAEALEAGGPLELIDTNVTLDAVAGLQHLKDWLTIRGKAMQPQAAAAGLDPPKGVLLTGVPGCGKSLVAKGLAGTWGYPLVLLDPARLYGQYVGQSEQRLQAALTSVEAMAPAVLWIDEIEKGFAQGGEGDGGVSARLLGTFLRWMQDRPPGVFIVATANDVEKLPAEFLRKGRFDEVFFVDLPTPEEREAVLRFHLSKRKQDPTAFDLKALVQATDGFSGAEIEAAIVSAMYRAFADGKVLTTDSLLTEIGATQPLSRTRAEDITALRLWSVGRAVLA